ncbi:MAG: alternative ribosome rescue aminoacyl-tRNA hydrolase ArfB [Saprospiraceae bacterium]
MKLPDLTSELSYRAVRGSGPGGQHVNKTSTKVELRWSLSETTSFSEQQKIRLSAKLESRLTTEDEFILTDHSTRSQSRNREIVTKRFYDTLKEALKKEKLRRKTKPTNASKRRRLDGKKRRGEVKSGRGRVSY